MLPLDQHAGAPAVPLVKPGDRVLRGQPIAEPGWRNQRVAALARLGHGRSDRAAARAASHAARLRSASSSPTTVVTSATRSVADRRFEQLSPAQSARHIARGGIVGLGGAVFPTAASSSSAAGASGLRLLLNGAECEPYISCDDMLMRERARDVVFGARILLHALGAKSCIDRDRRRHAASRRSAAQPRSPTRTMSESSCVVSRASIRRAASGS